MNLGGSYFLPVYEDISKQASSSTVTPGIDSTVGRRHALLRGREPVPAQEVWYQSSQKISLQLGGRRVR